MNIIEAISLMRDGKAKYIKRPGTTIYKDLMFKNDCAENIRIFDMLADDWEVVKEKEKKTITAIWLEVAGNSYVLPNYKFKGIPHNAKVTIEWEE